MASSDYDRPMSEQPVDSTAPPHVGTNRTTWTGPLGIVLAIIFIVLLLMALLG
jgi:hypothetical protein